jgi:hypothetical protein
MKLSEILQKSEDEMLFTLKRNALMDKRKKKKADLEKFFGMIKGKMEKDLKDQNKKSEEDFMSLDELCPATCRFSISEQIKPSMSHFAKTLKEYVKINNDYVDIKNKEEKVKTKKQKTDNLSSKQYEMMDEQVELEKQTELLVQGIPEALRP